MNNVLIKIEKNMNILLKLGTYDIHIINTTNTRDGFILEIPKEDLEKIPKFYSYKLVKSDIITRFKNFFKRNKINMLIWCGAGIFFLLVTNLTMEVKVIHNDLELRNLILDELEKYHIKRFTFKKSFSYISKVKEEILNKYKDKIEWLEIERVGLDYEVKVTERIIPLKEEDKGLCNIVAKKEGIITKVTNIAGETLVHNNSYVNKGDVIISGAISFNGENKGYTCAIGNAYAEVWYTVSVEIPLYEEEKIYTGKTRYNLKYSKGNMDYPIFKSRLKKYETKDYKIISLLGNELYLTKEIEYQENRKNLTEEEALKKADLLIAEKINLKLQEKEHILYKKVLKKSISGSKMIIEAFVATEEQIGMSTILEIPEDSTKEGE